MSGETLDSLYFDWLYGTVDPSTVGRQNPRHSWRYVFERLHLTPFNDSNGLDLNRSEDGKELRVRFLNDLTFIVDQNEWNMWYGLDCSVAEALVALSERGAMLLDGEMPPSVLFWELVNNLGLYRFNDENIGPGAELHVDQAIIMANERRFDRRGNGGYFPLKSSRTDQRKVDMWYQLAAYFYDTDRV